MSVRRAVLLAVVVLLLGAPLAARPQQRGTAARVGVLSQLSSKEFGPQISALREGLREHGYVDSQNITIEWRWALGDVKRFPDLAAELVRLNVDVIVASVNHAIQAARAATQTIPIVMVTPSDPVGLGFVRTLARPGGNVTGLTWQTREMVPKRLQLLKAALPNLSHVAVIGDPTEPARRLQVEEAERASSAIGVQLQAFEVRSAQDLEAVFAAMAKSVSAQSSSRQVRRWPLNEHVSLTSLRSIVWRQSAGGEGWQKLGVSSPTARVSRSSFGVQPTSSPEFSRAHIPLISRGTANEVRNDREPQNCQSARPRAPRRRVRGGAVRLPCG